MIVSFKNIANEVRLGKRHYPPPAKQETNTLVTLESLHRKSLLYYTEGKKI